jgi:hypothetical protein
MADNVAITAGSGTTIRTKDRTAVETQIVALDLNPAGAETLMSGTMPTQDTPATSGGTSSSKVGPSAASNNATSVKASAGQVYGYEFFNIGTAWRYVKLYNKASAPAPATDNALLLRVIGIPPGGGVTRTIEKGQPFSTGIAYAIVNGITDTDNVSIGANEVIGTLDYK